MKTKSITEHFNDNAVTSLSVEIDDAPRVLEARFNVDPMTRNPTQAYFDKLEQTNGHNPGWETISSESFDEIREAIALAVEAAEDRGYEVHSPV